MNAIISRSRGNVPARSDAKIRPSVTHDSCDWCGERFRRLFPDDYYCSSACRDEHAKDQRARGFEGIALAAIVLLIVLAGLSWAHSQHFTDEENAWLSRQHAQDGMKCCDRHDTQVGQHVTWRLRGSSYEVLIGDNWHVVPDGRVMRHHSGDPSPWAGEALLFYTPSRSGPPNIWCFSPEHLT